MTPSTQFLLPNLASTFDESKASGFQESVGREMEAELVSWHKGIQQVIYQFHTSC
ncbi:hypothetical protein COLO4_16032 [Corchorus olitorius]|uniref:Uncharacterized protein n=1 Tax=Corchorus olitorius TaxID=93759 RepID=A0A1R3JKB2_9ROSI|nr:hypothetical protein COLO4_16032 [Corchorus olitorius]